VDVKQQTAQELVTKIGRAKFLPIQLDASNLDEIIAAATDFDVIYTTSTTSQDYMESVFLI